MINRFLKHNKLSKYLIWKYMDWRRSRQTVNFVKSLETYLQDYNAGNGGDRLKHALIMEVLQHLKPMSEWSYRETHAGAGFYSMNAHSRILFKAVLNKDKMDGAGSLYRKFLEDWWNAGAPGYPGSVLLASRFLNTYLKDPSKIDIRVTEIEPAALSRLKVLSGDYGIKIRADIFDKQIDWLCQGSSLLFVVDPYFYDRYTTDTLNGRIGRVHLYDLFNRLSQKNGAILFIFTADPTDSPRKTYEELKYDIDNYNTIPIVKHFLLVDKQLENEVVHNHYWISIVGFGTGIDIVNKIPGSNEWNSSWLNIGIFKETYDSKIEEVKSQL